MARALEGKMASIDNKITALDGIVRELGQKKDSKPNNKAKKEESSTQKDIPPAAPAKAEEPANEWTLYERAYTDFIRGDKETAARGFLAHLSEYPDSSLADDSLFWLGESFLAMNNFQKASEAFGAVWDRYPTSVKAGAALLQCAEALIQLGRVGEAVIKLKTVADGLPGTPEATEASQKLRFIEKGAQGQPAQ
jgi:tol-pal system protein YbgF